MSSAAKSKIFPNLNSKKLSWTSSSRYSAANIDFFQQLIDRQANGKYFVPEISKNRKMCNSQSEKYYHAVIKRYSTWSIAYIIDAA